MSKKLLRKAFTFEGKRYWVSGYSNDELIEKMTLKKKELEDGRITINNSTLFKDWAIECIETYKTNQKEVTKKTYMYRINHCLIEPLGNMKLKSIKPIHCQQVLNDLAGKSKSHINIVYQALNFILDKAVDNNLIPTNPAKGITKPSGTKTTRRAITEYEREHIIKVAKTRPKYNMYLLMLFCGCRPSEACEVQGRDLEMVEGYPMLHIRGTKTDNADRHVPMPMELLDHIGPIGPYDYVAHYENGNPVSYSNRNRVWDSFKREVNLSMGCRTYRNQLIAPYPFASDVVPYCLRHTYCTDLAKKGVDLRVAQKLMGHSSITLTANIYTHVDKTDIVSVAKLLNAADGVAEGVAPSPLNLAK